MAVWMIPAAMAAAGALSGYLGSRSKQPRDLTANEQSFQQSNQYALPAQQAAEFYNMHSEAMRQAAARLGLGENYFQSPTFRNNVVGPSAATQQGWAYGQGALPYYLQGAQQAMQGVPLYGEGAGMMMQGTNPMMLGAGMMGGASRDQQGVLNLAGTNYGQLSTAADVANNPWVQGQLAANQQNVTQALKEQWLPSLQNQSVAGGGLGSSRSGLAQALGIERAAQQLANTNASTLLGAYGQGLGAQQAALGMTPAMLQAQTAPAWTQYQGGQMMSDAGQQALRAAQAYGLGAQQAGLAGNLQGQAAESAIRLGQNQEGYNQQLLDEQRRAWEYFQMAPWQRTALLQSGVEAYLPFIQQFGSNKGNASRTMTNPYYNPQNPWASALGGAMTGFSMGMGMGGGGSSSPNGGYNVAPMTGPDANFNQRFNWRTGAW